MDYTCKKVTFVYILPFQGTCIDVLPNITTLKPCLLCQHYAQ